MGSDMMGHDLYVMLDMGRHAKMVIGDTSRYTTKDMFKW